MFYPKLLVIAPYEGMAETFSQVAKTQNNANITIRTGNLEEGLRIAYEENYRSYDVIISRGGTATLLRSELDIPVIEASISVYDVLRAIKMAENFSGRFVIAGFSSITDCAKILCDLLQYELEIITYQSENDALSCIQNQMLKNTDLIICDMIGTIICNRLGVSSILISNGVESIQAALDNALQTVQYSKYVHRQKDLFQAMLTLGNDEYIVLGEKGDIWYSTLNSTPQDQMILNFAQTYRTAFLNMPDQQVSKILDAQEVTITSQHFIYQNTKYTFLKICKKVTISTEDDNSIMVYNAASRNEDDFSGNFNSANYIGDTRALIESYGNTPFPVLITGESGSGKDRAAALIHEGSSYKKAPLYTINCALITERQWTTLLSSAASLLTNVRTTIYFRRIDALTPVQLDKLLKYAEQTNLVKRNRLIFSIPDVPDNSDSDLAKNRLTKELLCMVLHLPPLRERLDDLPSITTLYLSQTNTSLGKQIIGFTPEAMELMQSFTWPHNLDQLHRIIHELAAVTKGPYIQAAAVKQLLKKEAPAEFSSISSTNGLTSINLHQPLDDINYEIIYRVLQEENNNRERAAKRLGISRSTLWRMLKSRSAQ
ncbi:MAG: PrpR N-terminal domain-containing protein [Lachnospiraceae bacterium]|nr:PrpR N-terminal domain-containing protein [Lachnospiraceae bacterium]